MASKTLLIGTSPDRARRAHNCQGSARHRIQMGDLRLAVKKGRSTEYYCQPCAVKILKRDLARLEDLLAAMESSGAT